MLFCIWSCSLLFKRYWWVKNLGIQYISQATKGPDNIGALTVYGAWQFYGINVKQNIQSGNMNALTGYQRADDKKEN